MEIDDSNKNIFNEIKLINKEKRKNLESYYKVNRDKLSKQLIDVYCEIFSLINTMQKKNNKKPISYIVLSILRISVLNKDYVCKINAYDSSWYCDDSECTVFYDASWFLKPLEELERIIQKNNSKYINKIKNYEIEKVVQTKIESFYYYIVELFRYIIPELEKNEQLKLIKKNQFLDFRIGEFYDRTYSIYKFDTRVLDIKDTIDILMHDKYQNYKSYKNMDLKEGNYENLNLIFCDFSGSNFEGTSFKNSNLIGTSWRNCNLEGVDFSNSNLSGADFRGASLETTNFEMARLPNTLW